MSQDNLLEENILSILNLEDLPTDEKVEVLGRITDLVQQRVFNRVFDFLSEDEKKVFVEALENKDEEKVQDIFQDKGEKYLEILKEEVVQVKQELKEDMEEFDINI